MRNYEEMVKRLREADEKSMCGKCGLNLHSGATKKGILFADAADAIEELLIMVDQYQQIEKHNIKAIEGLRDSVNKYKEAYINEHDERIEETKRHKWISVEERMPDTGWYLVRCNQWGGSIHRIALWDEREGDWTEWTDKGYDITEYVTHYMPFPEPPKEV